jgi:uncharacterized membrane protein YebE (DUF533 family)
MALMLEDAVQAVMNNEDPDEVLDAILAEGSFQQMDRTAQQIDRFKTKPQGQMSLAARGAAKAGWLASRAAAGVKHGAEVASDYTRNNKKKVAAAGLAGAAGLGYLAYKRRQAAAKKAAQQQARQGR